MKNYLNYAESVSIGLLQNADTILSGLRGTSSRQSSPPVSYNPLAAALRDALLRRDYAVDECVGASLFRFDLAVSWPDNDHWQLGLLLDQLDNSAKSSVLERFLMRPQVLQNFGWQVMHVLSKDWFHDPQAVLTRIDRIMKDGIPKPTETSDLVLESPKKEPSEIHDKPESVEGQKDVISISSNQTEDGKSTAIGNEIRSDPGVQNNPLIDLEIKHATEPGTPIESDEIDVTSLTEKSLRLECTTERHNKFWEIRLDGKNFKVRYGRIGTKGQSRRKKFSDHDQTFEEARKLIREKILKGYVKA